MRTTLAWLLLLPLGITMGCNGDDNDPDTDPPVGDDDDDDGIGDDDDDDGALEQSRVRVLNLSDDLGPADLYVERVDSADDDVDLDDRASDEIVLYEDLAVAETSPYLTVAAGSREIEMYPADADAPALEAEVALEADMDHTVVVWGDLPELEWLVVEDDDSMVPADVVAVEVMNLDGSDLTVYDATPAVPEPPIILQAQIPAEGETVPAASSVRVEIEADVTALGVDVDGDAVIDFEIPLPDDLQLGELHHLALEDDGEGGMDAHLVEPDGDTLALPADPPPVATAQARLANISPALADGDVLLERVEGADIPLIDRPMDEVLLFEDLGYAGISAYFGLDAGVRDLEIYAEGEITPFVDTDVALSADDSHTVFTYGAAGAVDALAVEDDDDGLAAGEAALVFTNLAPSIGEIDILDVSDPAEPVLLVDDLTVESSVRVDVLPTIGELGIDVDEDGVADYTAFMDLAPIEADEQVHVAVAVNAGGTIVFFTVARDGEWAVTGALPPFAP